jgi:hypothetical protein
MHGNKYVASSQDPAFMFPPLLCWATWSNVRFPNTCTFKIGGYEKDMIRKMIAQRDEVDQEDGSPICYVFHLLSKNS